MKKPLFATLFKATMTVALIFSAGALQAQDMAMPAPTEATGETVVDVIKSSEDHTVMAALLDETMLAETLSQQGSFTILAPTDDAFQEVEEALNELRANPEHLQQIVLNHLFQGAASSQDVEDALEIEVVEGDMQASNGLVHSIDQVILSQ
ncbi:MAG: fasciclin domain-containing protein [Balneolales bacterium]|nr:fasciclin domain-containing protein [Balneolales bacterium]